MWPDVNAQGLFIKFPDATILHLVDDSGFPGVALRSTLTGTKLKDLLDFHDPRLWLGAQGGRGCPAVLGDSPGGMARETEVARQSAKFGALDPTLDVNLLDGIPLLNVIYVFEEVQVQMKSIWGFHTIWQLLPLASTFRGF